MLGSVFPVRKRSLPFCRHEGAPPSSSPLHWWRCICPWGWQEIYLEHFSVRFPSIGLTPVFPQRQVTSAKYGKILKVRWKETQWPVSQGQLPGPHFPNSPMLQACLWHILQSLYLEAFAIITHLLTSSSTKKTNKHLPNYPNQKSSIFMVESHLFFLIMEFKTLSKQKTDNCISQLKCHGYGFVRKWEKLFSVPFAWSKQAWVLGKLCVTNALLSLCEIY